MNGRRRASLASIAVLMTTALSGVAASALSSTTAQPVSMQAAATIQRATAKAPTKAPTKVPAKAPTKVTAKAPAKGLATLTHFPAPVGQTSTRLNQAPMVAIFSPARRGRVVRLEHYGSNRKWRVYQTGVQDAGGRVTFQVTPGSSNIYRASVTATAKDAAVVSPSVRATMLDQVWGDDFNGTKLDLKRWSHRVVGLRYGNRKCSESDPSTVSVQSGVLNIRVRPYPVARNKACPYGQWANGMISTQQSFHMKYGYIAARIKFPHQQGQHGSLWSQPMPKERVPGRPGSNGAEIDIVEYFGDNRPGGGLSHLVHWYDITPDRRFGALHTAGGKVNPPAILPKGRTWASDYHVYSVQWTPTWYIFRIDGVETLRTTSAVSQVNQYILLSLVTSDWELPAMRPSGVTPMQVDWVRVWQ